MTKPYLCLNMIVKDESHIIKQTLEKLFHKIPEIDYYIISDTGSTDNTIAIIQEFFAGKKIEGEITNDEWVDFGTNRTIALTHAFQKSEYLMVFDADDEIVGDFKLPDLRSIEFDAFHFQFGPGVLYNRILLINNSKKWIFKGVLHEFFHSTFPNPTSVFLKGNYYVVSGRSGSRNKDPMKYVKDALLLEEAFEKCKTDQDPLFNRYGFYCAQSYDDAGKREEAIRWYKKTLALDGWIQERYWSCFKLYHLLKGQQREEEGIFYLVKSIMYDVERYDCLYELCRYYCGNGMDNIAWNYYQIIRHDFEENYLTRSLDNKLFYNQWFGDFGLPYYMIIVSINLNHLETTKKLYDIVLQKKCIETSEFLIGCFLSNFKFLLNWLDDKQEIAYRQKIVDYIVCLESVGYPMYKHHDILKDYRIIACDAGIIQKTENCIHSKKILIYSGWAPYDWNYTYYQNNALGGSETMIMQLAVRLPKTFTIFIVGNVTQERFENIQFIPAHEFDEKEFYAIIISRHLDFFDKFTGIRAHKVLVWIHDICIHHDRHLNKNDLIDQYICLTEWHRQNTTEKYPIIGNKITIIPNCIDIKDSPDFYKIKNRFVYSSCMERGLDKVLELWVEIDKRMENAELYICGYNLCFDSPEHTKMKSVIDAYDSIHLLGKMNKGDLYHLMKSCEFWLYPTQWPETSCITAMEMMAHQVLCLYYPVAGLVDTIGDYGIRLIRGQEIEQIMTLSVAEKRRLVDRAYEHSQTFLWKNQMHHWHHILNLDDKPHTINGSSMIKVLNLRRRKDRREQMILRMGAIPFEFFEAIDGALIKASEFLSTLFHNNDFCNRKSIIGCALSHLFLWKSLARETIIQNYVVLEDDVTLATNFLEKIEHALHLFDASSLEMAYIGSNHVPMMNIMTNDIAFSPIDRSSPKNHGTFGYILSKRGALKLLHYVEQNGLQYAIDKYILYKRSLEYWCCINQALVTSIPFDYDSDIQYDFNRFIFSSIENRDNRFFSQNFLTIGFYIGHISSQNEPYLQEIVEMAEFHQSYFYNRSIILYDNRYTALSSSITDKFSVFCFQSPQQLQGFLEKEDLDKIYVREDETSALPEFVSTRIIIHPVPDLIRKPPKND